MMKSFLVAILLIVSISCSKKSNNNGGNNLQVPSLSPGVTSGSNSNDDREKYSHWHQVKQIEISENVDSKVLFSSGKNCDYGSSGNNNCNLTDLNTSLESRKYITSFIIEDRLVIINRPHDSYNISQKLLNGIKSPAYTISVFDLIENKLLSQTTLDLAKVSQAPTLSAKSFLNFHDKYFIHENKIYFLAESLEMDLVDTTKSNDMFYLVEIDPKDPSSFNIKTQIPFKPDFLIANNRGELFGSNFNSKNYDLNLFNCPQLNCSNAKIMNHKTLSKQDAHSLNLNNLIYFKDSLYAFFVKSISADRENYTLFAKFDSDLNDVFDSVSNTQESGEEGNIDLLDFKEILMEIIYIHFFDEYFTLVTKGYGEKFDRLENFIKVNLNSGEIDSRKDIKTDIIFSKSNLASWLHNILHYTVLNYNQVMISLFTHNGDSVKISGKEVFKFSLPEKHYFKALLSHKNKLYILAEEVDLNNMIQFKSYAYDILIK